MVDRNLFMETLHEVAEIARTSETPLTLQDVDKYFGQMDLSEEQEKMVYDYLQLPQAVKDYVPETEEEEPATEELATEEPATEEYADSEEPIAMDETDSSIDHLSDSAYFRMYLNEVRGLSVKDDAQQKQLYQKLIDGDQTVIETIVENWLMRIIEMAKLYQETDVNMEDVIQEGNMGLFLALSTVPADMTSDNMELYLIEQIKDAMENYIREITGNEDQVQAVLAKSALLRQAQEYLAKENGETPSLRMLSEYTHIPAEEIQDILALIKEPTGEQ